MCWLLLGICIVILAAAGLYFLNEKKKKETTTEKKKEGFSPYTLSGSYSGSGSLTSVNVAQPTTPLGSDDIRVMLIGPAEMDSTGNLTVAGDYRARYLVSYFTSPLSIYYDTPEVIYAITHQGYGACVSTIKYLGEVIPNVKVFDYHNSERELIKEILADKERGIKNMLVCWDPDRIGEIIRLLNPGNRCNTPKMGFDCDPLNHKALAPGNPNVVEANLSLQCNYPVYSDGKKVQDVHDIIIILKGQDLYVLPQLYLSSEVEPLNINPQSRRGFTIMGSPNPMFSYNCSSSE